MVHNNNNNNNNDNRFLFSFFLGFPVGSALCSLPVVEFYDDHELGDVSRLLADC